MKVTIKGIVKENREDLLIDKIVESLLNDTEYKVYHRFMGEYVCEVKFPMFKGLPRIYDRVDIVEFINMFKDQKDSELTSFRSSIDWNNYLESNYGISGDYYVSKIGVRYYNILFTRILKDFDDYHYVPDYGPVNESVDKKLDDTINRIVDYMIEDTKWDVYEEWEEDWSYVMVTLYYPGGEYENYRMEEMERDWDRFNLYDGDVQYVKDHFGIDQKWIIEELYNRYIKKLRPIIYEEMKNYEL